MLLNWLNPWLISVFKMKCLVPISQRKTSETLSDILPETLSTVPGIQEKLNKYSTLCNPMGCTVHWILQATVLEWVLFPFFRGSSQPRDQTQVSHIAGGFLTNWAIREAPVNINLCYAEIVISKWSNSRYCLCKLVISL